MCPGDRMGCCACLGVEESEGEGVVGMRRKRVKRTLGAPNKYSSLPPVGNPSFSLSPLPHSSLSHQILVQRRQPFLKAVDFYQPPFIRTSPSPHRSGHTRRPSPRPKMMPNFCCPTHTPLLQSCLTRRLLRERMPLPLSCPCLITMHVLRRAYRTGTCCRGDRYPEAKERR